MTSTNNLTTGQAAKILHVSEQTVRDWTDAKRLTAQLSAGGHRRYDEFAVRHLALAERGIKTYWQASVLLRRRGNGTVELLDEDEQPWQAAQAVSLPLDTYLHYHNGLEQHPRALILQEGPLVDARTLIETAPDAHGSLDAYTGLTVSALDEETCLARFREELPETMTWFKRNAIPVSGIVAWQAPDGINWRRM